MVYGNRKKGMSEMVNCRPRKPTLPCSEMLRKAETLITLTTTAVFHRLESKFGLLARNFELSRNLGQSIVFERALWSPVCVEIGKDLMENEKGNKGYVHYKHTHPSKFSRWTAR